MEKNQYSMAYRALSVFVYALIYFNVIYCIFYFKDYLSYDLKHYIAFFSEIEPLTAAEFFANLITNFPYYEWGYGGKFEFGFSIISYLFVILFDEYAAYAAIASISILIKISILYKSKTNIFVAIGVLLISGILFEANALRAGVAASLLMLAIYFRVKERRITFVFFLVLAPMFHVSSAFYLIIYIFSFLGKKIVLNLFFVILYLLIISVVIYNFDIIFQMAGGKLDDYYFQAVDFGLYVGASGVNVLTLCLLLLCIGFYYSLKGRNEIKDIDIFFVYSAMTLLFLGFFSGVFSVIFDRLSQFFFVIFPVYFMFRKSLGDDQYNFSSQIFLMRFNKGTLAIMLFLSLFFYYSYYSIVFAYPQSNLYYYATGVREYDSHDLY